MTPIIQTRNHTSPQSALQQLRKALSQTEQNELLYALEIGELLRASNNYAASTQVWLHANDQILAWERTASSNPRKLLAYAGASTVSERLLPYEGQDYEKTWLTTRIALNHIAMGDWQAARVDIKRTHEREAIIANFRAQELAVVREKANQNGWELGGHELGGYPVQYLQAPEVQALANSYQNAFSHYLAGFVYEVLNEPSLAAPGYRQAIELRPGTPVLEEGLRDLDERLLNRHTGVTAQQTDVLLIIESGDAPTRTSYNTDIPIPFKNEDGEIRILYVSIAYPVIRPAASPRINRVALGNYPFISQPVVDLNVMARRALHDEMPGLILRGLTRATSKGALQYYAYEKDNDWLGILASLFSIATERANDRIWRTLPGSVAIARAYMKPGEYPLIINNKDTGQRLQIQGQYAVVPIRISQNTIWVGKVGSYSETPPSP